MDNFQVQLILCPTDFSDLATFALHYATHLAACVKGRLLVVYADTFLPPPHFTAGQIEALRESLEHSKEAARDALASYVHEQVGSAIAAESLVIEDMPVPAILKTAETRGTDLIVMGTHGRSGLSRVMLGSVTERVLRETHCPVLTVRYKRDARRPDTFSVKTVLCPVNYTEAAHLALNRAVSVALCFDAELIIMNVVESGRHAEAAEKERLCAWIPKNVRARCSVREIIRRGNAAEQIIETAQSSNADMIVLGAEHRRFFDTTVIGTTTVRVTRHAPCAVLTVVAGGPGKA